MATYTTAGATLAISAALPATHNAAGFSALSYTVIDEITDLGEGYARAYNTVEYSPIANREVQSRKGSYTSGNATVTFAVDEADAGQDLLRTAGDSDNLYSFRLVTQDGVTRYFKALVMGTPISLGTIDNMVMVSTELKIQDGGVVVV